MLSVTVTAQRLTSNSAESVEKAMVVQFGVGLMSLDHSVSGWIASLKAGEQEAAQSLWQRYFQCLVAMARKRLSPDVRRVTDEEDVAISVFRRLCDGAVKKQFLQLHDRDDLWSLLTRMTRNRIVDLQRRADSVKRGQPVALTDYSAILQELPTPEQLVMMAEEHYRLLKLLDNDLLRTVATRKMEGATDAEVAAELELSERSIRRKLQIIRESWSAEISS